MTIGDRQLHLRNLDTYAYEVASLHREDDDEDDQGDVPEELDATLEWARAWVCVLQQSLPWPFRDILLYRELDTRPAHRILYCCAAAPPRRLRRGSPRWSTSTRTTTSAPASSPPTVPRTPPLVAT
ncbi:hypothetical protein ACFVVA_41410 [Kitasatospora sp. NPDC058048]|uniref:hypothetical protein n=1 Tax=Kitasatospora sp. NPDC058048 TaxID=3346313 RepID=UPI0036DB01DB